MSLIKSISGIRGTIGGKTGDNLTPLDVVKFTAAYGTWLLQNTSKKKSKNRAKVVIGRDGRISGMMVKNLVASTLCGLGIDVIDLILFFKDRLSDGNSQMVIVVQVLVLWATWCTFIFL
jgi:phosphomannomutase